MRNEELERIEAGHRGHPVVLRMRFHVYAVAKGWELALVVAEALDEAFPENVDAWVHRSFVLQALKRAQERLQLALENFPRECWSGRSGQGTRRNSS